MCVCVCIYIYIYIHTHIHIYIHTYIYKRCNCSQNSRFGTSQRCPCLVRFRYGGQGNWLRRNVGNISVLNHEGEPMDITQAGVLVQDLCR